MKLLSQVALAALCLSFASYTYAQDDEAEVEIEDDEDEIAPENLSDEPVQEEPKAQLSPEPLEGVRSFIFFPEGPTSITGGKMSEVVLGVQNNGDKDIEMVSCNGRMMMPGNPNEAVQNFTNVGYENHAIFSKSEASFSYAFMPHMQTGGREFQVVIDLIYKEKDTQMYYKATPYDETVQVLESQEGVMTEIVQLYMTLIALAIAGVYFLYQKFVVKKMAAQAVAQGKKVERGTVNEDVDMAWIPQGHQGARKRSTKA